MNQSKIRSSELLQALEDIRPSFLDKKITIDDISNDIREVERELNSMGAVDEFSFELEKVYVQKYARCIEAYEINAPIISRNLSWKKHGDKWRLFYELNWESWDIFSSGEYSVCSEGEVRIISEIEDREASGLDILNEFERPGLGSKPLIDTKSEIRQFVHPKLPAFLKAFSEDWKANKYSRSAQ